MKNWAVWAFLFFLQYPIFVAGAGPSHASELILLYMNYLAEEEYNALTGGKQYDVAPDCIGNRAGGRCTLKGFILHIWEPEKIRGAIPTVPRPTAVRNWNSILDNPTDHSVGELSRALDVATVDVRIPGRGGRFFGVCSAFSPQRTWRGKNGYNAVIKSVASKLLLLTNKLGTKTPTESQKKILDVGKDAIQAAMELRFKDIEQHRIPALTTLLGYKPSTKKYTIRSGFNQVIDILDPVENEKAHPGTSQEALRQSIRTYTASDSKARSHDVAFRSLETSAKSLGCAAIT